MTLLKTLNSKQLSHISQATFHKCRDIGLRHAEENSPYIRHTIFDLPKEPTPSRIAIVISAGPSLHLQNPAKRILKIRRKIAVICADGALYYSLRNGLVPDYVVSVDPHPTRILRLFGDSELSEPTEDDYFRRQDLDPVFHENEMKRNAELIRLVDRYGPKIKMIISTSISPKVTRRCLEAGMQLYWWNPIYDDYEKESSWTRKIFGLNHVPCMATGGNVGTSAWVFAVSVLQVKRVALIGMDLSYPPQTPSSRTQYYHELKEIFGEKLEDGFIKVRNPYLKQTWYTDPAYYWYRENFLQLAPLTDCITYNCTEGGILFGNGIRFCTLNDFVKELMAA